MNLHPLVIHFPIAFLTIYAIFEFIRFQKVTGQAYWFNVKKTLILIGWVGSLFAATTGLIATGGVIQGPRLFIMHETFALTTIVLSTIASIFYIKNKQSRLLILIALFILVSITITAGLGGAMAKGTRFDPLMAPIFKLLGVY